ncbi:MAG: ribosome maturation factor RimM [Candidatus Izemoplasmatales bacterium]|jgi:16S rRNA processing protein RimM|nr:ribosome maturation factor RimM [Candidatus Izemoplasmatales bacterium]
MIRVGKILKPRGLKGELKVKSETDYPELRFSKGSTLQILFEGQTLPVTVEDSRLIGDEVLLVFHGFSDINQVEKFRGAVLFADELPEDQAAKDIFHARQLIGLTVYQSRVEKGSVTDIKSFPQGDYLEVTKSDQSKALIPFRDEFVLVVDLEKRMVEIAPMEGLL